MNENEFRELSAARALHQTSRSDDQRFDAALSAHPEWQHIVDEDLATAAAIGELTFEVAPPLAMRSSILDLIDRTPQDGGVAPGAASDVSGGFDEPGSARGFDVPQTPSGFDAPEAASGFDEPSAPSVASGSASGTAGEAEPAPRRKLWFALAACVAVLLAVSLALPPLLNADSRTPVEIALSQVEEAPDANTATADLGGAGRATLHWSDAEGVAVLTTEAMTSAPAGQDYELWIVRGETPISLGVMSVPDDGATGLIAEGFQPGDTLAVTVETEGGSPTGAPTTTPILVIPTS